MRYLTQFSILSSLILAAGCANQYPQTANLPGGQVISSPAYSTSGTGAMVARSDQDLAVQNQIMDALQNNSSMQFASGVRATVQNGVVTLSGSVPTDADRQAVESLVRNTTGVTGVVDQLQITPLAGTRAPAPIGTTSDQTLVQRVKDALTSDPSLSAVASEINVSSQDGNVALTGTVSSAEERQTVDDLVRNIPGVIKVYDQMQITAAPTGRAQAPIYNNQQPAQPQTQQNYSASTSGSVATGDIFNLHVQGLNNTDRDLAQRILQGLRTDSLLASLLPEVNINVAGGRVILQGTVQNEQQRQTIASVVQRAAGASNVENQLQVRNGQ